MARVSHRGAPTLKVSRPSVRRCLARATWHVAPRDQRHRRSGALAATFRSKILSSQYCFAKGSRGGTWHVPRGTWRHVTNAIVVPALWRIFWCLSRPDRTFRSAAINKSPWTNIQTNGPANYIKLTVPGREEISIRRMG